MCGIGGYFLTPKGQAPAGFLEEIRRGLHHRGPDGSAVHEIGRAGFVHTRLSIIDIEGGAQPFIHRLPSTQSGSADAMLVANGEIYNYEALRAQTIFEYATRSDCEVALPLWLQGGADFARSLRGMYALALYNGAEERGCLVRDAFGIKPLYYLETGEGLFFASEPAALATACTARTAPNLISAAMVLDRQYDAHRAAEQTGIWGQIKKLQPGEIITIEHGRIIARCYDRPLDAPTGQHAATPETLDQLLEDSVYHHQLSDVPFGMFLSGGVDSSALLAMMARLNDTAVTAYSLRFDSHTVADETEKARLIARKTGAEFIEITYDRKMFWQQAGLAALACDEPAADYAILPTLCLAERASRDVKVVLSGEGGDEFFAGYGRYRAGRRLLGAKPLMRAGPALKAGILHQDIAAGLQERQHALSIAFPPPSFADKLLRPSSALRHLQRVDSQTWLPDNLLVKLDRCLMRYGVEGRTPFIDKVMSPYGYHLRASAKIRGRQGKYLLKQWLETQLPEAEPFQRKRGFSVPVGDWIAEKSDIIAPLLARQPLIESLVSASDIHQVLASAGSNTAMLSWRLLFMGLWHQIHYCGVSADQPIDAILAAQ
jgi:asparagine synthase (glutamine-hydrolysing)